MRASSDPPWRYNCACGSHRASQCASTGCSYILGGGRRPARQTLRQTLRACPPPLSQAGAAGGQVGRDPVQRDTPLFPPPKCEAWVYLPGPIHFHMGWNVPRARWIQDHTSTLGRFRQTLRRRRRQVLGRAAGRGGDLVVGTDDASESIICFGTRVPGFTDPAWPGYRLHPAALRGSMAPLCRLCELRGSGYRNKLSLGVTTKARQSDFASVGLKRMQ